jgi:hypothetical protein
MLASFFTSFYVFRTTDILHIETNMTSGGKFDKRIFSIVVFYLNPVSLESGGQKKDFPKLA